MPLETKQIVRKKFMIGVGLIALSLIIGKLVLIPVIIFPGNKTWQVSMLIVYALSWIPLIVGIYLAGLEGYRLVTHKYKHYKKRTIHHVKNHGKNAAVKVVHHGGRAVKRTVGVIKKGAALPGKVKKSTVKRISRRK